MTTVSADNFLVPKQELYQQIPIIESYLVLVTNLTRVRQPGTFQAEDTHFRLSHIQVTLLSAHVVLVAPRSRSGAFSTRY